MTDITPEDDGKVLSEEAEKVLGAVLNLEQDNVHLEKPRGVRKEVVQLIKNHVR